MSTTATNFFQDSPLADYLSLKFESLERQLGRIDDPEQLDEQAAQLVTSCQVEPCELRRDEAEFDSRETPKGVSVTVSIPYTGDSRLFWHRPEGLPVPQIYGEIQDDRGWAGREAETVIRFKRDFHTPRAEEVRVWAKEQVDGVEQVLAAQRRAIEQHNEDMRTRGPELVERRRQVLRSAAELRKGLGKGI